MSELPYLPPNLAERFNSVVPDLGSDPAWDRGDLAALLALTRGDDGAFYSQAPDTNLNGALFGGQLVGQAVAAAAQAGRSTAPPHCVQINFLTAGQPNEPMRYETRQLMRGLNFSVQQVLGMQGERIVVSANVSFHRGEAGPAHSQPQPVDAPDPESLPTLRQLIVDGSELLPAIPARVKARMGDSRILDLRPLDGRRFLFERTPGQASFRYWIRVRQPLAEQPAWMRQAALGYLSDYWFPLTGLAPLTDSKLGTGLYIASLNHSVWFHRPVDPNEWLFVDAQSPATAHGRSLATATVYARSGEVVASFAQESLYRGWTPSSEGEFMAPGLG
ncbi:acyl-CoA thioesterase II [Pelomonas sp. KK5]|uniref:acyl-CoA thioesterase n=1 Tax=Pelomonas sp. KK5 TaxID=1855730 RepID=UPI00097C2FA2|nr:acyl-CoA thioesterase domain-containing protein [Pelomonas sp. KK5]